MNVVNDRHRHYRMKTDNWDKLREVGRWRDDLAHKRQQMEESVRVSPRTPDGENAKSERCIKRREILVRSFLR